MSKYLPLTGGKIDGGLDIGDNITIWSDGSEGGNIIITSPSSIKWEIDAFDDDFRIFSSENSIVKIFRLYRDGNITTTDGGTFLNSNNYTTWASPIAHTHNNYLSTGGGFATGTISAHKDVGVSSSSYSICQFVSVAPTSTNSYSRAGYGFHNAGSNACELYLDTDGNLRQMTNSGSCYKMLSTAHFTVSGTTLTITL